ncbi:MAG TPA: hypothetical protein VKX39_18360 [Bryobacteraceae bacterium]|nr:hypothetical protein [Bryobacteraceae bacterium]
MTAFRSFALAFFAVAALRAQPKLAFDRVALHQFEDGPVLAPNYEFVPGETAYFSCRIRGYATLKKDEKQSVDLSWRMRVVDPAGIPVQKDLSGKIEEEVLPQDKDWRPKFLASFVVPAFAPSGDYHIPVTVKDEIAGSEISTSLAFKVKGHDVQPSDTLAVRNFAMMRAENDPFPMRNPVYRPGEMLWAKFDIVGYKFGENNRFSVSYGLAILDASGKQVFAQPDAASESKESFYPQRYVPGVLSVSLDPNVTKAVYTLVVSVEDKIGNQKFEIKQPFSVE